MSELRQRSGPSAARRPTLRLVEAPSSVHAPARVDSTQSGLAWTSRYATILRTTDAAIVVGSVGLAMLAALLSETAAASEPGFLLIPVVIVTVWLTALAAFQTRESHILASGALEYKRVLNASALAFGFLAIGFVIFPLEFARGYFVLALPIGAGSLLVGRWICRRWLLRQRRFGHYLSRALVVGKRADVNYVIQQLDEKAGAGYFVVGVAVDDGVSSSMTIGDRHIPIVAGIGTVAAAAAALHADTVIVAGDPTSEAGFIRALSWSLEGTATELVLSSRLTDVAGPRIHFRPVEGLPLIHVEIPKFDGWRHVYKRAFDVLFAATALLVLAPVLVGVAIWIRLDSSGPAIFRQERCGRNGEKFEMLKFRSMVVTAEDDLAGLLDGNDGNGVLFKLRNDPRVTRAGRWLRKFSLDELPQFWNVLIGDMSIVGPRPPLQSEADVYEDDVRRRLFIKPGLTGLWQISGRSDLSWEESVRLDLYYVENWSLTGDLIIIWRTIHTVIRPVGAY
ncbi:sugar transferase [Leifsonia sp. Leaf264]|uniref:sugar transferase n=1 Tax=Leifsonia sp. Leaf264 TaxID=1736314 RepID=UPI0006F8EBC9|nr:sugar transferase [Leifsonia sp. Leaf264]KQO97532.1 polyprenyl glycosylphosphotransferase [Leifsonia sp. Leaf264]